MLLAPLLAWELNVLRLASNSRVEWITEALSELDNILIDHAHCEKKAASSALNFIFRYPEHGDLMRPLSGLAREELRHFEMVLEILKDRSVVFKRHEPSLYAGRLVSIVRKNEPERMLDMMICAAIIEARSCERMTLLADALALTEPKLSTFYRGLLISEARHHQMYLSLLKPFFSSEVIAQRIKEITQHEAEILIKGDPNTRLHS